MPEPSAISSMFGRIAGRYDLANRLLSLGIDLWWRRCLVGAVKRVHPHIVLDLATGSGDVAFALCRRLPAGSKITGMDFCEPMLDEARRKQSVSTRFQGISFRPGDGLSLPDPEDTYDAVTIAFGLRNMADRHRSLTEMLRVLRPGGRAFILEFSQPHWWFRAVYQFYLLKFSPILAGLITGDRAAYEYLGASIRHFPDAASLAQEIRAAGFCSVTYFRMTFGIVALHQATK